MNHPRGGRIPPVTIRTASSVQPLRIADARNRIRHVFIRDLTLTCRIGVHRHEHISQQRVRINLDLAVMDNRDLNDDFSNVVCYERIADGVREIVTGRHIKLVETLAEDVAVLCLVDQRVSSVRVRIEKLDAFSDASSVGVEIERFSSR